MRWTVRSKLPHCDGSAQFTDNTCGDSETFDGSVQVADNLCTSEDYGKLPEPTEKCGTRVARASSVVQCSVVQCSEKKENPPKPPQWGAVLRTRRGKRGYAEICNALGEERMRYWLEFWSIFPCHESKQQAMDTFECVVSLELWEKVRSGAKRYAARARADNSMKLKVAQGWLYDARWDDDDPIVPRSSSDRAARKDRELEGTARELFEQHSREN
jgi:hypothetical protein